jgi:hypothetical protein
LPNAAFARLCCALVISATLASAGDKFPDYPVRAAGDYAITATVAGVTVGVQPVESVDDQKTYFNTELSPKGFIPVFVVIQNAPVGDSYFFEKANVQFGPAGSSTSAPTASSKTGEVLMLSGAAVMSPLGMFIGAKMISNASKVQQNMLQKELQSTTLSPGGALHGFLYIPAAKKGQRDKIHLKIPIVRAGTGETLYLEFLF